jgi:hypothetical protein
MSNSDNTEKKLPTLAQLKRKYSAALYSYFRVTNLQSACEAFVQGDSEYPHFLYPSTVNQQVITTRLASLQRDLKLVSKNDTEAASFLKWRLAETELLDRFWKAYESGQVVSPKQVKSYQKDQVELYGRPNHSLFAGILAYVKTLAIQSNSPQKIGLYTEIEELLGHSEHGLLYMPQPEIFKHYQKLFALAFPALYEVIQAIEPQKSYDPEQIETIFEEALKSVGADKMGWKIRMINGGANVVVSKHRREVMISNQLSPRTPNRLKQMVAHEIGCHVQRGLSDARQNMTTGFGEHDEGLAIVLEQLLASRFVYKRATRYLAVCLGLGIDGTQRNFRQVYEIIWRTMVIRGASKKEAKERAFYECARVFRGGLPMVPGMVYIKDKVYLESNLLVWQNLAERPLEPEDFHRLFIGHDTMLSKEVAS